MGIFGDDALCWFPTLLSPLSTYSLVYNISYCVSHLSQPPVCFHGLFWWDAVPCASVKFGIIFVLCTGACSIHEGIELFVRCERIGLLVDMIEEIETGSGWGWGCVS